MYLNWLPWKPISSQCDPNLGGSNREPVSLL